MGGTDFKWGGRAPLTPPLATALITKLIDHAHHAQLPERQLGTTSIKYIVWEI